ncbi:MAG: ABC transporter substrate-binding protein [Actinobacteria bacterium]|nr:ABC transporter substrate-binding protein [Actinomycetota bacterium]
MTRKVGVGLLALLLIAGGVAFALARKRTPAVRQVRATPADASGSLTIAYPQEPVSFDPYSFDGRSDATLDILRPVLPTLLDVDPKLRYVAGLAQVPRPSQDKRKTPSVTYRLDAKAVWSDGKPITAEDIVFTWNTVKGRKTRLGHAAVYSEVQNVVAVGTHTVRIEFSRLPSAWRDLFSSGDFILPKHLLEGQDIESALRSPPTFSGGPYLVKQWIRGKEVDLVRNPKWWKHSPVFQDVRIEFVDNIDTAIFLLQHRTVAVMVSGTEPNLSNRLARMKGVRFDRAAGSSWWELAFNMKREPGSSQAFREAVSRSIDRQGIVDALIREQGRGLDSLTPQIRDDSFKSFTKDVSAAGDAFKKAGFTKGAGGKFVRKAATSPLLVTTNSSVAGSVVRAIQKGLEDAGLEIDLAQVAPEELYSRWRRESAFDMALWEHRGSPSVDLRDWFRSDRISPQGMDLTGFASDDIDARLDAAASSEGSVKAVAKSIAAYIPVLPMFESDWFIGFDHGVVGPTANATVDGPFWNLWAWRR